MIVSKWFDNWFKLTRSFLPAWWERTLQTSGNKRVSKWELLSFFKLNNEILFDFERIVQVSCQDSLILSLIVGLTWSTAPISHALHPSSNASPLPSYHHYNHQLMRSDEKQPVLKPNLNNSHVKASVCGELFSHVPCRLRWCLVRVLQHLQHQRWYPCRHIICLLHMD